MWKILSASALLAAALVGATAASASSDQAWAAFNARATRSCVSAAGIRNARPSSIVGFDDRVGLVAMLVSDRSRGSNASKLCLYNKRTQKAYIDQADGWIAPPRR